MSIGTKLVAILVLCLTLNYPATLANPADKRIARSSNDIYDWLSSLFDYDDDSEEYLLCRNCTVVVAQDQRNGTATTAAPVVTPPNANGAPTVPTSAPAPVPPNAPPAVPDPNTAPAQGGAQGGAAGGAPGGGQ